MRRREPSWSDIIILLVLTAAGIFFALLITKSTRSLWFVGLGVCVFLVLFLLLAICEGANISGAVYRKCQELRLNWLTKIWIARKRQNQCLRCGYNLTGNTSGVCPECGNAFRRYPA